MPEIHCHRCGGFIGDPAGTTYRAASSATPPAAPHSGMCMCGDSVVYGPAPVVYGPAPTAEARGAVYRIRSASRN